MIPLLPNLPSPYSEIFLGILAFAATALAGLVARLFMAGAKQRLVESLVAAIKEIWEPAIEVLTSKVNQAQSDINYIKNNGVETKRRISNLEERVQQGAVEFHDLPCQSLDCPYVTKGGS